MAETGKDFFENFETSLGKMKQRCPETLKGFSGLFQSTMSPGELSVKQKELIALAVGLAVRCKPCIVLHVQKALQAGATRQEILEAAGVTVMMGGGPAYTHVPEVMKTLEAMGIV